MRTTFVVNAATRVQVSSELPDPDKSKLTTWALSILRSVQTVPPVHHDGACPHLLLICTLHCYAGLGK